MKINNQKLYINQVNDCGNKKVENYLLEKARET